MADPVVNRRDFVKGSTLVAALVALPAWLDELDEEMPRSYMTSSITRAINWTRPAGFATLDPAVLALNRLGFGPRPGDVERVQSIGLNNYIEEQMAPDGIDDSQLDEMLAGLTSLTKSAAELSRDFDDAQRQQKLERMTQSGDLINDPSRTIHGVADGMGRKVHGPNPAQPASELIQATILRQIYSERQLLEVMVDFWSNHFNIYIMKDKDRFLKVIDDREVIRPYALGKFSDLLQASAHSPAMLVFLDNVTNINGVPNENYSRELMELHTLGVTGGYSQEDVLAVARCFTGWGVNGPAKSILGNDYSKAGTFIFRPKQHDDGEKLVLGTTIAARGGVKDGEQVLDILANHPSTADFISRKLVQRFVSDEPPPSLVSRAAGSFSSSRGDIRTVLNTILHSSEFSQSFGGKVKRPLEFVASSVRALGGQFAAAGVSGHAPLSSNGSAQGPNGTATQALVQAVRSMGQVPFMWPSPNGYPDVAGAWINSNGLLARWNLAIALASNHATTLKVNLESAAGSASLDSADRLVDFWIDRLLHRDIPGADRAKLTEHVSGDARGRRLADLVALILASPHFQLK